MGGRYSVLSEPKTSTDYDKDTGDAYFALALQEPNRICLIHAGADVIGIIQRSIHGDRSSASSNPNHQKDEDFLQKEQHQEDGSYEFQFRGHPFSKFAGRASALKIKRLLCQLVADLYMHGWDLSVASDLTTDDYHTTWFFRRTPMGYGDSGQHGGSRIRSKRRIISLSLSGSDGLTLVNAPERLRKALIDAVRFGYTYGTESEDVFEDDLEIKLNGGPWETSMLEEGIWARKLLLEIFRQFSKCRYVYYAVADTKGTADSIFFIHQQSTDGITEKSPGMSAISKDIQSDQEKDDAHSKNDPAKVLSGNPSSSGHALTEARRRSNCCSGDDIKISSAMSPGLSILKPDYLDVNTQPRRSSWQEQPSGQRTSSALQPIDQYPFQIEQFCMISLNRADSLRLIDAPKSIRELTKDVIVTNWPYGLQREIKHEMAYEYRMGKSPWAAVGGDAVAARSFLTVLFEKMLTEGWRLLATLDISRRRNDKSVFVIRKDPSFIKGTSILQRHFCVSMTDGDKIRIIRGDDQVIRVIGRVINDHWPYGIQKEREFFGAHEIQLIGHPWLSLPGSGNEPLAARVMLLEMLRAFQEHNWRVIVSADVSGRYQTPANLLYNPVSVDSWIVVMEGPEENGQSDSGAGTMYGTQDD